MSTDMPYRDPEPSDEDAVDSPAEESFDDDGVLYDDEVTPEYGILGFTLRELLIVGAWLVSFVLSFFPLIGPLSLWSVGIEWVLPIGVPTAATFLIVLRRFSPDGIRRVGSLGIDQFASVAFSVAACLWIGRLWLAIAQLTETGVWTLPWYGVVQVLVALALVALTVFAPLIPGLKEDFHGRLVTLAHRNANPVRPVIPRPRPEQAATEPAATEPAGPAVTATEVAGPEGTATEPAAPATAAPVTAAPETPASAIPAADSPVTEAPVTETPGTEIPPVQAPQAGAGGPAAADEGPAHAEPDSSRPADLDVELSDMHTTDEVARYDVGGRVPISAHASGGGTGTADTTADETYVPSYSRRSRAEEIVSDTASIEELMLPADEAPDAVTRESDEPQPAQTPSSTDDAPTTVIPTAQPFWILAPTERDVLDELGRPLFRIGPTAWALVIEDRGGAYVVRHDDGRIGYLHDIADVTKG